MEKQTKMGRPKKSIDGRDKKITIRISGKDLERLGDYAKRLGVSRADTIIHGLDLVARELGIPLEKKIHSK